MNYSSGTVRCANEKAEIIDVPGTYSLKAENPAEKVATDMIKDGDVIVNVVDATNLERNLNLTLQVLEYGKPTIVCLNMSDDARHLGIEIDKQGLEEALGVPIVETVALTGQGLKELIEKIPLARSAPAVKRNDATTTNDRVLRIVFTAVLHEGGVHATATRGWPSARYR